jgi:hypothetical protein
MRVGALQDIKLKHLKRVNTDNQGTYAYKITVYVNFPRHRYTTFCTPECAKMMDNYLEVRKRYGENIKQDTKTGNWLPIETPFNQNIVNNNFFARHMGQVFEKQIRQISEVRAGVNKNDTYTATIFLFSLLKKNQIKFR